MTNATQAGNRHTKGAERSTPRVLFGSFWAFGEQEITGFAGQFG